jgi:hypothetical protein
MKVAAAGSALHVLPAARHLEFCDAGAGCLLVNISLWLCDHLPLGGLVEAFLAWRRSQPWWWPSTPELRLSNAAGSALNEDEAADHADEAALKLLLESLASMHELPARVVEEFVTFLESPNSSSASNVKLAAQLSQYRAAGTVPWACRAAEVEKVCSVTAAAMIEWWKPYIM